MDAKVEALAEKIGESELTPTQFLALIREHHPNISYADYKMLVYLYRNVMEEQTKKLYFEVP